MKSILFINFFLLACMSAGQIKISGYVGDKEGPIIGANIYLENTYDGSTSDTKGQFYFETFEEGEHVLIASFVGYNDFRKEINLNVPSNLSIRLEPRIDQLNTVTIAAGSFNTSDEAKKVIMKSVDVVTTAGATADIAGALNTLPGTQTVGEAGRLFVRGGDGYETRTFIDGMMVHNEYSPAAPNTPSRSRFSPFIFKGTSFSTGGYSAEYGQALSSALILDSKDVSELERTDFSIMSVGGDVAHTHIWDKSSFSAKMGYTNLSPYFRLAPQRIKWDGAPEEWLGNFAFRWKTSDAGLLKVFGNLSLSKLDLYEKTIEDPSIEFPVGVDNNYSYLNVIYRNIISKDWAYKLGASNTYSFQNAQRDGDRSEMTLEGSHLKGTLFYTPSDRITIQTGGEIIRTDVSRELSMDQSQEVTIDDFNEYLSSGHIESEIYISAALAIRPGARIEYNSLTGKSSISPRFSMAQKVGEFGQTSLAYGLFHQSAPESYLLMSPQLQSETASHYILNYQWMKRNRTFRIETYSKRYSDLVKETVIGLDNSGNGFAQGFDLWWRDADTFDGLDYWISYSYIDTKRDYRNFPGKRTPSFASSHNFSFVAKKWIDKLKSQVGITYTFGSPRPYTDLNTEGFLQARTSSFHDLSFNISYLMNSQVIIHALVNNVLGINNVFGYEYANNPDTDGFYARRAITPPARRFIFLGIFITLSKDQTINQLPNL